MKRVWVVKGRNNEEQLQSSDENKVQRMLENEKEGEKVRVNKKEGGKVKGGHIGLGSQRMVKNTPVKNIFAALIDATIEERYYEVEQ